MTEATPMMRQYQAIKREIPDQTLLFFRLGDFYELFFDDAREASSLLNLTLTKRHGVPMCGVPCHQAEHYIAKIINAGRRVAICDQISEPRPGQVVERAITQIFTPGCVINLDITSPKENRYLAAVSGAFLGQGVIGAAFLDASTGEFHLTQLPDRRAWQDELIRFQPHEIIYPAESPPPRLPDGLNLTLTPHDDWAFDPSQAELLLCEHFKVQSLDGFGCSQYREGIAAAGALFHYVTQGLRTTMAHLHPPKPYVADDYLVLDHITQRNLELVTPMTHSTCDTTLFRALDQTRTPMGGRMLRHWILHPLTRVDLIQRRLQTVAAWLEDVGRLEQFRALLNEVRDLERLIGRLSQGGGNARDLAALAQSLIPLPRLIQILHELNTPLASELAHSITPLPDLISEISRALVEDPPASTKEGGMFRRGYDAALDELLEASRSGKEWIAALQAREIERTGIKSLKIRFNQVFGYYIEVTRANLNQVPADYIRKQTMVNAERFITPELKQMEEKILGAEERARQLELELFHRLRATVVEHTAAIQASARAIATADVLASFAQTSRFHNYCRPEFNDCGRLHIQEGRHPVLEQLHLGEKFVPNDTELSDSEARLIILTGPNMAGKSTFIRQVALLTLMAHMGCYVPASRATFCIVDRIFTRVGANDDLSRGQSTFMVEMSETANILNNATQKSLVILDEIGRGTSTFDGLSIAWSVAEFLHDTVRAKTLFATHYHELTELGSLLSACRNYNVAVREWHDQIVFLRKIVPGGTDKSYGIQVARLAGLPRPVLDRAKEILRKLEEDALDEQGNPVLASHHLGNKPQSGKKRKTGTLRAKGRVQAPQLDLFKARPSPACDP